MSRPVRRVTLYGYLGSGNIGNDASFETVLTWLNSVYPEVTTRCITIAPAEVMARYGVPAVSLSWRPRNQGRTPVTQASRKLLGRLVDVPRSFALAGSSDAVVVPGMGVLEQSLGAHPLGLPLWLYLMAAACRLRRRHFVLLDVGAEWAANPLTRRLYVETVRLATHVSYRDESSAAVMQRAGARPPDVIAPDLAFAHPAPTVAAPESGLLVVGVMAFYGHSDDPVRGSNVRRRYVATLAEAMTRLAVDGHRVVLVGGDRVDVEVARDVRAAVMTASPGLPDEAVQVRDVVTFTELTDEMKRADVVIASRFHNLICSLRLARPTVSVGYAQKSRRLMQAMGLDAYCQDIEQLNADQLVAQVRAARREKAAVAARIHDATCGYVGQVESLLERVTGKTLGLARIRAMDTT